MLRAMYHASNIPQKDMGVTVRPEYHGDDCEDMPACRRGDCCADQHGFV